MWPFGSKRRDELAEILRALVEDGRARRELDLQVASKRMDMEMRRLEYEERTIETRLRHEDEMQKWKAEARLKRQEQQRERNQTLPRDSRGKLAKRGSVSGTQCRVCDDPSDITLTSAEIIHHNRGHLGAYSGPSQPALALRTNDASGGSRSDSPELARNNGNA